MFFSTIKEVLAWARENRTRQPVKTEQVIDYYDYLKGEWASVSVSVRGE